MRASRKKPIPFGIVHGLSGWSDRVWRGGGPERSIPNRRFFVIGLIAGRPVPSGRLVPELRDRLGGTLKRHAPGLAAAADLHLDLALGEGTAADRDPQRAAEQLGIGELLPRPGVAIVVEDAQPS